MTVPIVARVLAVPIVARVLAVPIVARVLAVPIVARVLAVLSGGTGAVVGMETGRIGVIVPVGEVRR